MHSSENVLDHIDVSLFNKKITENLINNITKFTCSALANIMAIDYTIRLNSQPAIKDYVDNCIHKLKAFLGQKVMTDDSFSTILTLFSVAISSEQTNYHDMHHVLDKKQSQDAIINTLINKNFNKLDSIDQEKIKLIFKDLLAEKSHNRNALINYMQSEPELFCTTIMCALKKYQKQDEINNYVKTEINKTLNITTKFAKKINLVKQASSKIATAFCALTVGALSLLTAGAASSILVVPAAIIAMKYGPGIGIKFGEMVLKADGSIQKATETIHNIKADIIKNNQDFLTQRLPIEHSVNKAVANDQGMVKSKFSKLDAELKDIQGKVQPHNVNIHADERNQFAHQFTKALIATRGSQAAINNKSPMRT